MHIDIIFLSPLFFFLTSFMHDGMKNKCNFFLCECCVHFASISLISFVKSSNTLNNMAYMHAQYLVDFIRIQAIYICLNALLPCRFVFQEIQHDFYYGFLWYFSINLSQSKYFMCALCVCVCAYVRSCSLCLRKNSWATYGNALT